MALTNTERNRRWRERHPDWARDYYRRKPEMFRANTLRQRGFKHAYIDSLRVGGCVDCGNKNLTVLDFDHVRDEKVMPVSRMTTHSFAGIDAEIAKCEVRCANCHRIMTAARRRAA